MDLATEIKVVFSNVTKTVTFKKLKNTLPPFTFAFQNVEHLNYIVTRKKRFFDVAELCYFSAILDQNSRVRLSLEAEVFKSLQIQDLLTVRHVYLAWSLINAWSPPCAPRINFFFIGNNLHMYKLRGPTEKKVRRNLCSISSFRVSFRDIEATLTIFYHFPSLYDGT